MDHSHFCRKRPANAVCRPENKQNPAMRFVELLSSMNSNSRQESEPCYLGLGFLLFWKLFLFFLMLDEDGGFADVYGKLHVWARGFAVDQDAEGNKGHREALFVFFHGGLQSAVQRIEEACRLETVRRFAADAHSEEGQRSDIVRALAVGFGAGWQTYIYSPGDAGLLFCFDVIELEEEGVRLAFHKESDALADFFELNREADGLGFELDGRTRQAEEYLLLEDPPRWGKAQAVLFDLWRLAFIDVVELLRRAQNLASAHFHLCAVLVEEGVLLVFPRSIRQRIGAATALRQPEIPLAVDVRMMEVEDGILRCGWHRAHPAAYFDMHAAVRALDEAVGREEVGVAEGRADVNGKGIE